MDAFLFFKSYTNNISILNINVILAYLLMNLSENEKQIITKGIKNNFPGLSYAKISELLQLFEIEHISKREEVIKSGQFYTNIVFVISGSFRAYYKYHEHENTFWFREKYSVFASPRSIFQEKPSRIIYQALEDSVIATIDYKKLKELAVDDPEVSKSIISVLESLIVELINRIEEFSTSNAEQRYVSFLKNNGDIIKQLPQQQIASYLGITPESFSRLKSRLKTKND